MARDDDDPPWTRQLLMAAVVLVAVALVIGGVVSLVAVGAARVTGIGASGSATAEPTLYLPSRTPTTTPEQPRLPRASVGAARGGDSASAGNRQQDRPKQNNEQNKKQDKKKDRRKQNAKRRPITLQAFPRRVAPGQRINLTGLYPGGGGARLQVQRFEGGWSAFPVEVPVRAGQFSTYVLTGRAGVNRFRVVDPASGRASNPVRVTVR